ncbi:lysozyme inhibitor LprI family protein [Caulobacter sp. RL271]|uniref:Lysozyme inhibitor LprI family protein n=1 Tax=Caulobacter segnis TaxID=88688 RepID=A0ABY4ZWT9_9CAUL|nr:lysozyme inhibitor LprI family protein [Caulobacter segnis]USQ96366.1 lysozyme inhibitor LprI family protein [Caulobacter segnis]
MRRPTAAFLLAMTFAAGALPAAAASFDCAKAHKADERAICANRALNDQDVRMDQLYGITRHLVPMGGRGAIMDDQRVWLKSRASCGANRACLARSYDDRIRQLNTVMDRVYRQGPF